MEKPVIAITMGDPAGIGPELIVKVLGESSVFEQCKPVVVGDPGVLRDAARVLEAAPRVRTLDSLAQAEPITGVVEVLRPAELHLESVTPGKLDAAMGRAAALCLAKAFELAAVGEVDGVVAAPMNKQALHLAGYHYLDELEYLADLTRSPEAFPLGAIAPSLWTVAVTQHVPFRAIADLITRERVLRYTRHLHRTLKRVGFAEPRLAIAALNVHAGEGGLYGREELDEIAPAVLDARAEGMAVEGPVPADTVFVRAREGEFEGVVCMYHDQANIGRKLLATRSGATVFLGLPVVCATTAHGTAFDKAGQGVSDPTSLRDALRYAAMLARPARSEGQTAPRSANAP